MLADYHRRTKAQFDVLELEARTQRGKLNAVVARVKLVLDALTYRWLLSLTVGHRIQAPSSIGARWHGRTSKASTTMPLSPPLHTP